MIRDAVTCDRPGCLALYLEPDGPAEDRSFETAAAAAYWRRGTDGDVCPACAAGRGPVFERGECPRCCGLAVDLPAGPTCHYCGHVRSCPDEAE